MASWSRRWRRWDVLRVAAVTLAVVWIAFAGAYVFAASSTQFGPGGVAAAASALVIAASGFLYAWRRPAPLDR